LSNDNGLGDECRGITLVRGNDAQSIQRQHRPIAKVKKCKRGG
jgi:hypothetical protein